MILYLDTSAFIKLYIDEPGTPAVRQTVKIAALTCSNLIAYVEMRAALARVERMGRIGRAELAGYRREFERDWKTLHSLIPDEAMAHEAAGFAERFGLRGYDSLHLASAFRIHTQFHNPVTFACFDRALNAAAQEMGLTVLAGS